VTIIADAAPLIALSDANDPRGVAARAYVADGSEDVIVPAPVTAEVDYLLGRRLGRRARRTFLADLAAGLFRVECLLPFEYDVILELDARYADLDVGLADLSIVVLARRFRTRRVLTFDERHFRALRPLGGGAFTILPTDEP
jgi:uncharacterized protein